MCIELLLWLTYYCYQFVITIVDVFCSDYCLGATYIYINVRKYPISMLSLWFDVWCSAMYTICTAHFLHCYEQKNKFLKLTYSQAIANCIYPTYSGEQRFPTHFTVNIVIFNCITFMLTFDMVKVISSSMIATINAHRRRSRTTGDKFVRRPSCTFS